MQIMVLVTIAALVSGCASQSSVYDVNVGNLIGDRYVGRPVVELFSRYGAPLRQTSIRGYVVYSWEAEVTQHYSTLPPEQFRCQLDIYALDDIAKYLELSGQQGGCGKFIP